MRERSNSSVQLGVLSPWKGTHARPDCFVYNTLPYEDDLRWGGPRRSLNIAICCVAVDFCG